MFNMLFFVNNRFYVIIKQNDYLIARFLFFGVMARKKDARHLKFAS